DVIGAREGDAADGRTARNRERGLRRVVRRRDRAAIADAVVRPLEAQVDVLVQVVAAADTEAHVVVGLQLRTAVEVESLAEEEPEVGIELPGAGAPAALGAAGVVRLGHDGAATTGEYCQQQAKAQPVNVAPHKPSPPRCGWQPASAVVAAVP